VGGRHVRGKGYIGDMEKYREAMVLGYLGPIRATPQEFDRGEVISVLERWKNVPTEGNP
jgi:hypothetical protein